MLCQESYSQLSLEYAVESCYLRIRPSIREAFENLGLHASGGEKYIL